MMPCEVVQYITFGEQRARFSSRNTYVCDVGRRERESAWATRSTPGLPRDGPIVGGVGCHGDDGVRPALWASLLTQPRFACWCRGQAHSCPTSRPAGTPVRVTSCVSNACERKFEQLQMLAKFQTSAKLQPSAKLLRACSVLCVLGE